MSQKLLEKAFETFIELFCKTVDDGEPNTLAMMTDRGQLRVDIYFANDSDAKKKIDKILNDALNQDNKVVRI